MYATRLKAVLILLALGLVLVLGSLFHLQVVQGDRYRDEARQRLKRPPGFHPTLRGAVYDRNGVVLAHDVGAFDVAVYFPFIELSDEFVARMARQWRIPKDEVPARIDRMWTELSRLTGVPREELLGRMGTIRERVEDIRASVIQLHGRRIRVREETYGERTSVAHPMVYDVDLRTVGALASRHDDFPGLTVQTTRKREYREGGVAPHVIGRLGEVSAEELAGSTARPSINAPYPPGHLKRYWPGDPVGRGGVEGACENLLRGSRGLFQKGIEGELLEDLPPVPGRDVHLTLDIALEADVEDLLDHPPGGAGRTAGAAVVLDCRSGDVLVLATAPRYDPRTFQADFPDLARDPAGPLLNRAVQGLYPLGSVFKAITATAALHEGAITTQTTLTCNGVLDPAHPNRFRCDVFVTHGAVHGTIPLRTAIQKSCNLYFYQAAELLGRREGGGTDLALARDRLQTWAERFGLGRRAGLGLPGEQAGNINVGDPRNLAVGQGELLVTPFQVAQVYALVASDGRMPPPRLVRERPPAEPARPPLPVNPNWMAFLRDAFAAVVNEQGGTAYSNGYLPEVRYAGKTGTAQAGAGEPHAWFAGFAPAENPRVAFAIVVEHGGHGGTAAAPIARELVKACLAHGYLDDQPRGNAEPANGKPTNGRNGNGKPGNGHRTAPPPVEKPAAPQPVG